jgi:hypothetical protein
MESEPPVPFPAAPPPPDAFVPAPPVPVVAEPPLPLDDEPPVARDPRSTALQATAIKPKERHRKTLVIGHRS